MKNRGSLKGYGEILAGRIARPYEKGTPQAKQGDEYWFFIKLFASISREKASEGEERRQRKKRGKGWQEGREDHLCFFTSQRKEMAPIRLDGESMLGRPIRIRRSEEYIQASSHL